MPRVTPHNTNHLRQDATFHGGSERGGELKGVIRANRRKKRKLLCEAQAAAGSNELIAAGTKLVAIKRRWALTGSGGSEFDTRAARELERVYAAFAARWKAAHEAQSAARASEVGDGRAQTAAAARTRALASAQRVTEHHGASVRPRRITDKSRLATRLHPPVNPDGYQLITQ